MQTLFVVDFFQELADRSTSMYEIPIFSSVYLFILQRLHERLTRGIVPGIRLARHTDFDAVLFEQVRIIAAGVLRAAIRVMD